MPMNLTDVRQALDSASGSTDWLTLLSEKLELLRADALERVASLAGYQLLSGSQISELTLAFTLVSYADMVDRQVLVVDGGTEQLIVAIARPFDSSLLRWLRHRCGNIYQVFLADPHEINGKLNAHESSFSAVAAAVTSETDGELAAGVLAELTLLSIQGESSPAVRLVDSTIFDALRFEASDIHIESISSGFVVKFRIDGALNKVVEVKNLELAEQAIARIKVLAELDIAERRIPQDGRFRVNARGREIDIRVSIMPTMHGEDAVLRILDKQALINTMSQLTLDSLGFDAITIRQLRRLAAEPYGMLLVTGPTGSGKTTTLYAALTEINHGSDKILTIEDPVEYQLPNVAQIPVNEKKGLTFAVGLRSILRHDPDKILVGEIRDAETAQIAVQSALTGHMVFTSVHANNSFDVIGRFIHMGVDPYNFVSSLSGVVAQRLLRQNCPQCSEDVVPDPDLLSESGIASAGSARFRLGRGCAFCRFTGYKGRRAIAEVLKLNDEMREMIVARASVRALKEYARGIGTRFLREAAIESARDGNTSLQEVNRVTFVA